MTSLGEEIGRERSRAFVRTREIDVVMILYYAVRRTRRDVASTEISDHSLNELSSSLLGEKASLREMV